VVERKLVAADAGTVVIKAEQSGNIFYKAASVQRSITFVRSPEITMSMDNNTLTLRWPANDVVFLQMANSPEGPWEEVPEVVHGGEFTLPRHPDGPAKFYRLTTVSP
jgi:hypothetical protein